MSTDPLSDVELLYRHIDDDWVDVNGNANEQSCTVEQWKDGISCDRSNLRTPQDTVFGTGRTKVVSISVGTCRSLGLTVDHCPEPDPQRLGQVNEAHCTIRLPPGLRKAGIRELRTRFLECATTITVSDPADTPSPPANCNQANTDNGRVADNKNRWLGIFVAIGAAIGAVAGAGAGSVSGNIALSTGIGVAIGVAAGLAISVGLRR